MKMKISSEKFCEALDQLEAASRLKDRINHEIRLAMPPNQDFMDGAGMAVDHEQLVVDLLELLTNDKDNWISWWCWEIDYGREYTEGSVTYKGEIVDLSTKQKLYALLESEYENGDA